MPQLRDLTNDDLDALVRWRNDPEINRYLADRLKTKEEAEPWFNRLRGNPKVWLKAIIENGTLIGYAAVEAIDEKNRRCEMAMAIGEKDYWGKGIATEVLKIMLEYAFVTLGMHRVWAAVARGNMRSERLIERAGFIREGVMRETLVMNGQFTDLLCYSMLEDEYRRGCSSQ